MIQRYNGSDRRLTYLFDNANHVEVDRIQTAGTPVADITIDGETTRLYAPQGGGGTDVEANPSGTPTADLDTIRIGQVIYGLPGGYTYLPVIYSEQEHEVGVWTDGKPLYQKSIHFSSPVTVAKYGTPGTTIATIANIEQIVSSTYSTFQNGSSNEEKSLMFWIENNDIKASDMFSHQYYNSQFTDFTFQYTKTTDQPGSGTWTPDGEYAHHYSTAEQVVGTWIDGNTVYEKTFTGFSVTLQSGVLKDTGINVSYISKVISFTALSDDYLATIPVAGYKINGTLQMIGYQNGNVIDKCIVRYTKTT